VSLVAERYALALFQVSSNKETKESINAYLKELSKALSQYADVKKLFYSPMISSPDKLKILKTAVGGELPGELDSFFKVLSQNNRIGSLPKISKAFESLINKSSGKMNGSVVSATELSDEERKSLKETIEKELNTSVSLEFKVDPKVIGGLEAKVGSYIFEDSVQSHMEQLNDFITRRIQ